MRLSPLPAWGNLPQVQSRSGEGYGLSPRQPDSWRRGGFKHFLITAAVSWQREMFWFAVSLFILILQIPRGLEEVQLGQQAKVESGRLSPSMYEYLRWCSDTASARNWLLVLIWFGCSNAGLENRWMSSFFSLFWKETVVGSFSGVVRLSSELVHVGRSSDGWWLCTGEPLPRWWCCSSRHSYLAYAGSSVTLIISLELLFVLKSLGIINW